MSARKTAGVREALVEDRFMSLCDRAGVFVSKQTGRNGMPDRLLLYDARHWFVELKRPGKRPTRLQRAVARKITRRGGVCLWADNYDRAEAIVTALVSGSPPPEDLLYGTGADTDDNAGEE